MIFYAKNREKAYEEFRARYGEKGLNNYSLIAFVEVEKFNLNTY